MIDVLLVDDEALTLELHRAYVDRLDGFRVVGECSGARAAVDALLDRDRGHVDVILLDMTMPDGTGIDVLRHLRARSAAVDVIAITGVRDVEVVRQAVALGVAQYLVKPFTFATFRERMERYRDFRARADAAAGQPTQGEIDEMLAALRPAVAAPPPKGLSAQTLARVAETLRARGPLSSVEAATALGMSRVAARRYLEHLAESGRATRVPRFGTGGRPETEYVWRAR